MTEYETAGGDRKPLVQIGSAKYKGGLCRGSPAERAAGQLTAALRPRKPCLPFHAVLAAHAAPLVADRHDHAAGHMAEHQKVAGASGRSTGAGALLAVAAALLLRRRRRR